MGSVNINENIESLTHYIFEPSVNIFKNGIVINHHKVGTRFIQELASGNEFLVNTNNQQVQFEILNTDYFSNIKLKPLKYHFKERYVLGPWNNNGRSFIMEGYPEWKDDESFLKHQNVNTYTDFFFNNQKDIIFIIRNPIERIFSGLTQILTTYSDGVTIENFKKLLKSNWKDILGDIHTVNYLEHFKEMIYNINDKSKIKVIDLSHLKSKNACDFFSDLRGDLDIKDIYDKLDEKIDSNKSLYSSVYDLNDELNNSIFFEYLKTEYTHYLDLKSSEYFLDLS